MGRHKFPIITKEDGNVFYDENYKYEYGKCDLLREGSDITIAASGAMVPEALKWLDEVGDQAFFLYFHTTDPHWRYVPPAEYARWGEQENIDLIQSSVAFIRGWTGDSVS